MRILIFTQKVDSSDPVLGFFHNWLIEFSKKFTEVYVICLYEGDHALPTNVFVYSLGKEKGVGNIGYIKNLFAYIKQLSLRYDSVFVHMNPVYIVLLGLHWRFKNIPVYLWYVHKKVDTKLKLAMLFVKKVFTSGKESFGIESDKVVYVGHGIKVENYPFSPHLYDRNVLRVCHIGRITPIKNVDVLVETVVKLNSYGIDSELHFFGDAIGDKDLEYRKTLESLIAEGKIMNKVFFRGWVAQEKIAEVTKDINIAVNLAPNGGMDKAVLETILLGIPTFTTNTIFTSVFEKYNPLFSYNYRDSDSLLSKIQLSLENKDVADVVLYLSNKIRKDFSVESLVGKISEEIYKK
ncbi:MAG: glycosyltransferase family 4 protein [Patescibacteria group bacterium]